ncbi:hypothetical protein MetMK1DRAFT_00004990 [Metallosphaera yellowstonensis MK1]|jgi:hypothetical protein|uniref:Uncharacterized protein n=1 Tax=Metallosphaera yellowstonensis MK1 TaxID=671065 RepID=H2C176_9CREN|nr:hypothetical protein [Metallosphaera yellowstonensis]EHP69997.1 hypothetical protein MetMK1DRAFT_00004990 [Metallosphaera yellowstonensis MK1]
MKMRVRNHALYFIGILSYIVSLIPFFGINVIRALLLIPVIAYTLPILEYLQPKIMILKINYKDILLILLATMPYIFIKINIYIIIPMALLTVTFMFYFNKNTMWGNVLGTTFIVSLSLVWALFESNYFLIPDIYWILYIFTGALYVEYKIPYRRLNKSIVQASWVLSLIILTLISLNTPLLLVSLIEPSTRFLRPGEKLKSSKEIALLGRKGSRRDIIFVTLLILLSLLSLLHY